MGDSSTLLPWQKWPEARVVESGNANSSHEEFSGCAALTSEVDSRVGESTSITRITPRWQCWQRLATAVVTGRGKRCGLSWKVPRCARTSFSQAQAHSRRTTDPSAIAACLCRSTAHRCPAEMGRVCQATLRRTFASLGLSLSLYPSHRHRQLPPRFHGRRQGHLSLARLCPWIPKSDHDLGSR